MAEQSAEDKQKLENEKLAEFEAKLKKEGVVIDTSDKSPFDEYTTIRFLRARKLDVDAAYTMFTNHLKWREENGVDKILETAPNTNKNFKNLERYWPGQYAGVDKDGTPVWVERGGQIDPESLMSSVPIEDILNYLIYTTEKTMRLKKEVSAKLGKNCYKAVLIEDMDGFGRKHMGGAVIDLFKKINAVNEANYPECLKAFFAVNSPMFVSGAFKLVKSFIDPETRRKVFVLGSKFKDELLQFVDEDQIPEPYGGKNTEFKFKGGGIYSDRKKNGATSNPFTVFVNARDSTEVPVTVKEKYVGGTLDYWFSGQDVKFTVYEGTGKSRKELVASKMVEADKEKGGKFEGSIPIKEAGTVVLVFDNGHSWVKSKKITYYIQLKEGQKEKKKDKKEKKKKKKKSSD